MLQVFSINVYALLDPGATFYFVNPFLAMIFYILPYVFHEAFSVSTPLGECVLVKRVYRGYTISLPNRVTLVDLVKLDMLDFDVILGDGFAAFLFCFH